MNLAETQPVRRRMGRPSNRNLLMARARNREILLAFACGASLAALAYCYDLDVRTVKRAIREASAYGEMRPYLPQLANRRGRPGEDRRPGESREQYLQRLFEAQ